MKYISLSLLFALACASSLSAMETDPNNNNNDSIYFLSPQEILEQPGVILPSEEHSQTYDWINSHKEALKLLCQMRKITNMNEWNSYRENQKEQISSCGENSGNNNIIFDTGCDTICRVSGAPNTLCSLASNAGIDSGPMQNMVERDENGNIVYKDVVLQSATSNTEPIFQHTSMIAYYLLMEKRLKDKKVQPVKTWIAPIKKSSIDLPLKSLLSPLDDRNYVIVQPKNPESYKRLDTLDPTEFNTVVSKDLLPDLADAVDSGGWNLNQENLFCDAETKTFYITDLEKPNNEGWGPNPGTNPRWGTAVLSLNGDGTSIDPGKWKHNAKCGYDAIKSDLLEHSVNKQELVQEWDALKTARAPKE